MNNLNNKAPPEEPSSQSKPIDEGFDRFDFGFEKQKSSEEKQLVIFNLENEEFGVYIHSVKEIIKAGAITNIPKTDTYICGIIHLRGEVIVIVDLDKKLGLNSKKFDSYSRIIITEIGNGVIGFVVDSVTEVLRIGIDKIQDAPKIIKDRVGGDYLLSVAVVSDDRLIIVVDFAHILGVEELENISKIKEIHEVSKKAELD
ncbi:chemotaxis protein CheW [Candidatus Woesearchaeota archaeon]|nr:chemotaxis protein CheW [Candidatus Woesearchaeota archaeon]